MKTPDYDIIIIGPISGPAGCSAALSCRKFGLSVLMVTKNNQNDIIDPFYPSESVHPGIVSLLNHIGANSILQKSITGKYSGIKTSEIINFF